MEEGGVTANAGEAHLDGGGCQLVDGEMWAAGHLDVGGGAQEVLAGWAAAYFCVMGWVAVATGDEDGAVDGAAQLLEFCQQLWVEDHLVAAVFALEFVETEVGGQLYVIDSLRVGHDGILLSIDFWLCPSPQPSPQRGEGESLEVVIGLGLQWGRSYCHLGKQVTVPAVPQ